MKLPNHLQQIPILAITLLAFFLRAYRLETQSYWIDEAWSVYFANLSPAALWHLLRTAEPLPPFYYPAIIYWVGLVGDSEYAIRFFSLVFGTLAIPFIYRLAQVLGDTRLGWIAALLMAAAPYQIWHSQDARMYSILTAASVMSMWGFVNLWQRGGWRWWLVYVAGTVWAIMAHYHGVVLVGIQGLFLLLTWQRHRRIYLKWGATLLVILVLQLPWLIVGGNLLQNYLSWIPQPTLLESYIRSVKAYSLNELVSPQQAAPLMAAFVAVYIFGLIYAATRTWGKWRGPEMLALLLSFTLAPNLAAWLYGEFRTTVYFERYLIMVQVGYLLTIAIGVLGVADQFWKQWIRRGIPAWISRPAAALVLLTLVSINGWVLSHHYFDPAYAKPDWRAVAQKIEDFGQPGDAILLTGDGGELAFNFYYHGQLPVYCPYNISPHLKNQHRPEGDEAIQILADIAANHQRLWYTPYGMHLDPLLEGWLAENTYPAWHSWLGRKRLALYNTQPLTGRTEVLNVTFDDSSGQGPMLKEVVLPDTPIPAGDLLPLALTWQTDTPLSSDVQLSLRLINNTGDTFTQSDWPPLAARGGTSTWSTNHPIPDRRSLWIPPDVPPGNYLLQLVVYDPATGQLFGQPVTIPNIQITAALITPPPETLSIPNYQLSIINYQLPSLIGYAFPQTIQPGQEMWLWLYWQAQSAPMADDMALRVTLTGNDESVIYDTPLAGSVGSFDTWRVGQVRRAIYHLPTSPRLTGESAEITVGLIMPDTSAETSIGQIALNSRPRQFEKPAIAQPTDIAFGSPPLLTLIGFDLPANPATPGGSLPVTLYWQAKAEMDTNYTVFIQLLNNVNQVVAQTDAQPQAGAAPTTTWLPGEILSDSYSVALPVDLPPGNYRLITGLYDAATGQRLPASSGSDFVELGEVTVK